MRWMVSGASHTGSRTVVVYGASSIEKAVQHVLPRVTERYGQVRLNLEDIRNNQHIFTMETVNMDQSRYNAIPQAPQPPVAHATVPAIDPAIAVQKAQEALAEAEAALAAKIERDELVARLDGEMTLAQVTTNLLSNIKLCVIGSQTHVNPSQSFAKFRKELQPLAESYGYKIVLVGDKSQATLVKV